MGVFLVFSFYSDIDTYIQYMGKHKRRALGMFCIKFWGASE